MKVKFIIAIFLLSTFNLFSACALNKLSGKNASGGDFSALLSKKEELANFQPVGTSSTSDKETPKIKGKIAIVQKDAKGQITLDRFDEFNGFSELPMDKYSHFYPPEVYAQTPKEIDTLIKIECREFKDKDVYAYNTNSIGELKEFTNTICDVSVIDYKTKTLLAKTQKGDERAQVVLNAGRNQAEVEEAVANYLRSLPLELLPRNKATPSSEVLTVTDLAKSFKQSKENPTPYQDKEITVTGWGYLMKPTDKILLYGNDKESGVDSITCKVDPNDAVDFADLIASEHYKFTVIGKFDSKYTMNLEQCRFINAEQVKQK